MSEQRFETGKAPHVVVERCDGALAVGSWTGAAVLAQGAEFSGEETAVDQITLSAADGLTLTVPEKASLTIKTCGGPLTIKHVDGIIGIGAVGGAVTLNDVGSVKIKAVGGDLHGENINGPLALDFPQGTVTLRNVADVALKKTIGAVAIRYARGAVQLADARNKATLHTISGRVEIGRAQAAALSNLGGENKVSGVRGSLHLAGGLVNGSHRFEADGDILVAWPPDGPMTLAAEAAVIDNQLPLADAMTTKTADGRTRLTGHIENGKPIVSLKAAGNIGLKPMRPGEEAALMEADFDFTPPPPTLDEIVETAVQDTFPRADPAQIDRVTAAIEAQLAAHDLITPEVETGPPPPLAGKIAAAKAQRKVEKSLQKARETMAQAQAKLTARPASRPRSKPAPPQAAPPPEPEAPTSAQPSQPQILQLLKEGLITVEQANLLLNQLPKA